jgi:hypothetical protein
VANTTLLWLYFLHFFLVEHYFLEQEITVALATCQCVSTENYQVKKSRKQCKICALIIETQVRAWSLDKAFILMP